MLTLVLVTRDPVLSALAGLPPPWRAAAGTAGTAGEANSSGAWLDFYGIVRDREDPSGESSLGREGKAPARGQQGPEPSSPGVGSPIVAIDYEAHEAMAVHQMERILEDLDAKYPLNAALVIHRVGRVPVGEASLLVRILSPHRSEALNACAEFLDALKQRVPIWKHPIPEAAPGGPW